jgi:hypothetical protein
MGQFFSSNLKENDSFVLPTHVLTQDEFIKLVSNPITKKQLHNHMAKNNKYIKIFICEKETDQDRLDPDYLENCEYDDICADYVNQYYVAELKTKRTSSQPLIENMIWNGYHGEWSYGFDIYEMHRIDLNYKKLFLSDYFFCDVNDRVSNHKSIHMSNDLNTIFNVIKSLNRDIIEEKMLEILTEQTRLKEIAKINKKYGHKEQFSNQENEYLKRYMDSMI